MGLLGHHLRQCFPAPNFCRRLYDLELRHNRATPDMLDRIPQSLRLLRAQMREPRRRSTPTWAVSSAAPAYALLPPRQPKRQFQMHLLGMTELVIT